MSRALLVVVVALALAGSASAQFVVTRSAGFRVGFASRHVSVSVFAGGTQSFGFFPVYPVYAPPVFFVQPVVVVPPPVVYVIPPLVFDTPFAPARNEPAFDPDKFLVVRPRQQADIPPPAIVGRPPPMPVDPGLPRDPVVILQPPAERDPAAEAKRQTDIGREAFVARQYGRSVERFQQAISVRPGDAKSHFLLAQAYLAVAKYRDAVAAIDAGLALDPDWPLRRFDPTELYGNDRGAYLEHLRGLRAALAGSPDDPTLLFLLGYQEWFAGDRVKAIDLFGRARARTTQPGPIDLFLLAGPGRVVAR